MFWCTSGEEGEGRLAAEEDVSLFWWGEEGVGVGEVEVGESGSVAGEVGSLLWEAAVAAAGVGEGVVEEEAAEEEAAEEGEGGRCRPQSPGVRPG